MTTPASSPPLPQSTGRLPGIDVARAIAIIGMVMVHIGPSPAADDGLAAQAYHLSHGRAAILFALLAGVGVALLAGGGSPARLRSTRLRLAWRAVVLLPLGLALQPLDHGVLVILHYYAVYFVVAAIVVSLSDRWLLALAGLLAIAGPVLYIGADLALPEWRAAAGPGELGDPPGQVLRDLLLTGSYPALTWSAPVLLGIVVGRCDLRAAATRWWLLAVGVAGAAFAYGVSLTLQAVVDVLGVEGDWVQLAGAEAHSQMPLWLIGASGVAVAVLAACLLAAERHPRVWWPLAATGTLAFTVYVGHLLVFHAVDEVFDQRSVGGAVLVVALFTVVAVGLCTAWRAVFARGPLEAVLRLPWLVSEAVTRRR